METGRASVSRANAHVTYPARFQLVAAMNPCRCGYVGGAPRECGRAPRCGGGLPEPLSGPLLDRMDLTIEVLPVPPAELARAPTGGTTEVVAARIPRRANASARATASMAHAATPSPRARRWNARCWPMRRRACWRSRRRTGCGFRARGYTRTLRVARTIADLVGSEAVQRAHVAEALAFRHRGGARVQAA